MNADRSDAISKLLDDVYDEIDTEGWARGLASDWREGPCCVAHAVVRVALRTDRVRFVRPALRALARHCGDDVWRWNDKQRTAYPVLMLLEGVADAYRRD